MYLEDSMPTQFDLLTARLARIEDLITKLIHDLGPRIDQQSFEAGVKELGDLDLDQPVEGPVNEPRMKVPYKTLGGLEDFVDWNDLEEDMQAVIKLAREYDDPYQLYESPSGQIRIMVSAEVESRFRSNKLGNRT